MAAKSDYYDVLGVSKDASQEDIKKAYRKQALEWHPDKHKDQKEAAEKRFKEINEAYQVLSDPEKRKAYDQFGHQAFSPGGGFRGAPGGAGSPFGQGGSWGPFTYSYSSSDGQNPFAGFNFGDPFDIFEQFFGGQNPFGRAQRIPRYSVSIDFMDAIKGVEKEVNIGGQKRTIKIPAGVGEGQSIRFNDFILTVDVKPHDIFERDGQDIFVTKDVPFSLAVLGGQTTVPTVDGEIRVKIRPGTQSGTMVRLQGKGVPYIRRNAKGDEYVKVRVAVPKNLSRRQKNLVQEIKKENM